MGDQVLELTLTLLERFLHPSSFFSLQILLSAGAQVNKTGGYGDSPLFKAALHGRTEMIRTLLDAGE